MFALPTSAARQARKIWERPLPLRFQLWRLRFDALILGLEHQDCRVFFVTGWRRHVVAIQLRRPIRRTRPCSRRNLPGDGVTVAILLVHVDKAGWQISPA